MAKRVIDKSFRKKCSEIANKLFSIDRYDEATSLLLEIKTAESSLSRSYSEAKQDFKKDIAGDDEIREILKFELGKSLERIKTLYAEYKSEGNEEILVKLQRGVNVFKDMLDLV